MEYLSITPAGIFIPSAARYAHRIAPLAQPDSAKPAEGKLPEQQILCGLFCLSQPAGVKKTLDRRRVIAGSFWGRGGRAPPFLQHLLERLTGIEDVLAQ